MGEELRLVCLEERLCGRERRRNNDAKKDERTLVVEKAGWAGRAERRPEGRWCNRGD